MKLTVIVANWVSTNALIRRCATFKGRGLTADIIKGWLGRFDLKDQGTARRFLGAVRYFDAMTLHDSLVRESNQVMAFLSQQGVAPSEILVVQIDDIASSAAGAVKTFRRNAKAGKQCHYCMASDTSTLIALALTYPLRAIIYIDDFIGTGTQVQEARTDVISALGVSIPEFVITAVILEEAKIDLDLECTVRQHYVHLRQERPMLSECKRFSPEARSILMNASAGVGVGQPLGFGMCASMVVLSDDVPDNSPALLREGLFSLA